MTAFTPPVAAAARACCGNRNTQTVVGVLIAPSDPASQGLHSRFNGACADAACSELRLLGGRHRQIDVGVGHRNRIASQLNHHGNRRTAQIPGHADLVSAGGWGAAVKQALAARLAMSTADAARVKQPMPNSAASHGPLLLVFEWCPSACPSNTLEFLDVWAASSCRQGVPSRFRRRPFRFFI